jgi:hypothetical protein
MRGKVGKYKISHLDSCSIPNYPLNCGQIVDNSEWTVYSIMIIRKGVSNNGVSKQRDGDLTRRVVWGKR